MAAVTGYAASDFWNNKQPSEWSASELDQLKTKSPWAKKVRMEMSAAGRPQSMDSDGSRGTFGGMRGADANGISEGGGGRGGRGRGGTQMDAPQDSTRAGPELTIRWESAKPLLDAGGHLPAALENSYAISVTGLPPPILVRAVGGGGPEAMVQRLLSVTTLGAKGRDPQTAALVVQSADRASLIFGFSKEALPLTVNDKDVVFTIKLGAVTIKAKFEPKEMTYKAQLVI